MLPSDHHHHHDVPWNLSRRARLWILSGAILTLVLNATGVATALLGVNTALVVAIVGAVPLLVRAYRAIRAGRLTYDVTIAVAAIIAAAAGEYLAAAEVVLIVLVGDGLEHWAIHRADRAIAGLLSIMPDEACVFRDGRELLVPSTTVQLSDRLIVRGGERIAVDGVVVHGEATIDQSIVTGESIPILKAPGDAVFCGTILEHGSLEVQPKLVGQDTTLARIARLVSDARRRRAPLVRAADRLSTLFLPVILGSAVAVYLLSGQALRASAVLHVACSCALISAAPAAFAAALARLARDGVLVKGGDTLEALSDVTAVAFDKTGTLTSGRPSVTGVVPAANRTAEEVLRAAASLEHRSEHALGRAVVAEAGRRGIPMAPPSMFSAKPGRGVAGVVDGREVCVGSPAFLRELEFAASDIEAIVALGEHAGHTHVLVAIDRHIAGLITLQDTPRPDAAPAIAALKAAGIKDVVLLTGDERPVADAIANQVGIDAAHVHANLLPEQKLEKLGEMATKGAKVLMVGDGINDAPSLAAAHVGAAFGRGAADLSAEAAQIVVLEPRLEAVPESIVFARKTVRRVRFNILAFAVGVNVLAIILAGTGYLKPASAAILHQLVSLIVILGSVSLLIEHRLRDPRAWAAWRGIAVDTVDGWRRQTATAIRRSLQQHGRVYARVGLAAAAVAWLLSNVIVLKPAESAAVLRFGRLVDARLPPGLHVRLPWPIETVTRIAPGRVRVLELGFRSPAVRAKDPIDLEWSSPHGQGQVQQVAEENLVLTGDENMAELYAVVHYTIADPARFLFAIREPDALVRMVAEGTLRNLAASMPLDAMLTTDRHVLEERWAVALRQRLAAIGGGVDILGIHLQDVHPPVEVVDAFRDVASAEEEQVMKMNEADAYLKQALPLARGTARGRLEEAGAYKADRISRSEGDGRRFLARLGTNGSTPQTMFRLQLEAIEAILPGKRVLIMDAPRGARRSLIFVGDGGLLKLISPGVGPGGDEER